MNQLDAEQFFHLHGYRSTPQRHFILKALEQEQTHLTIEQLLECVREYCPQMTLSTIYRTLDLFLRLGMVRVTHVSGQQPYYERVRGPAHHHLLCRRCHSLSHLDETLLGDLHERLEKESSFHDLTLELLVTGYCETCWDNDHWR
ncbi:MAG: transcriptional repressor [Ktedonobacteraceae bacterium]|nr:transcriptional repressor [Ktedonobacteraceae bacterium]